MRLILTGVPKGEFDSGTGNITWFGRSYWLKDSGLYDFSISLSRDADTEQQYEIKYLNSTNQAVNSTSRDPIPELAAPSGRDPLSLAVPGKDYLMKVPSTVVTLQYADEPYTFQVRRKVNRKWHNTRYFRMAIRPINGACVGPWSMYTFFILPEADAPKLLTTFNIGPTNGATYQEVPIPTDYATCTIPAAWFPLKYGLNYEHAIHSQDNSMLPAGANIPMYVVLNPGTYEGLQYFSIQGDSEEGSVVLICWHVVDAGWSSPHRVGIRKAGTVNTPLILGSTPEVAFQTNTGAFYAQVGEQYEVVHYGIGSGSVGVWASTGAIAGTCPDQLTLWIPGGKQSNFCNYSDILEEENLSLKFPKDPTRMNGYPSNWQMGADNTGLHIPGNSLYFDSSSVTTVRHRRDIEYRDAPPASLEMLYPVSLDTAEVQMLRTSAGAGTFGGIIKGFQQAAYGSPWDKVEDGNLAPVGQWNQLSLHVKYGDCDNCSINLVDRTIQGYYQPAATTRAIVTFNTGTGDVTSVTVDKGLDDLSIEAYAFYEDASSYRGAGWWRISLVYKTPTIAEAKLGLAGAGASVAIQNNYESSHSTNAGNIVNYILKPNGGEDGATYPINGEHGTYFWGCQWSYPYSFWLSQPNVFLPGARALGVNADRILSVTAYDPSLAEWLVPYEDFEEIDWYPAGGLEGPSSVVQMLPFFYPA